ncbi:MAG TPA: asparagine synthetase B, partial [Chloroflexota bacterium]|nr:asparagine synthetase B [Chloroflexota bacterium]
LWRKVASLSVDGAPLGKAALAEAPIPPLPPAVVSRGKTGFSVPLHDWMLADRNISAERGLRGWARYVYGRLASS